MIELPRFHIRCISPLTACFVVACAIPSEEIGIITSESDTSKNDAADVDSPTDPDVWDALIDAVPGSRLRPIVRVGDDGTRAQVGWHDTMFDGSCEFRETD